MRAAKVDDNQKEIVKVLRQLGWSVVDCSRMGKGFPDLAIGKNGVTLLVEVKNPKKQGWKNEYTEDQKEFMEMWKGSLVTVRTIEDCLAL